MPNSGKIYNATNIAPSGTDHVKQENKEKVYNATKIKGSPPSIDGILDEPVWKTASPATGFIQYEPHERAEPASQTEFRILYDNNNLYIGIRAYEENPEEIVSRMTRRDNIDGDVVMVQIDSYNDNRTAFSFGVTAAGVKIDYFVSGNGQNEDYSWDPIWHVRTNIDESGWTAEMMIPFSQLRFSGNGTNSWGLQVGRFIYRKEEVSIWQFIPKDASGWVHLFGELNGISDIKPRKELGITPYTVTSLNTFEKEPGNPYMTGRDNNLNGGIDAKFGITNDLTMDVTINPDFGQVEADPSVVNLTAFETFYEEKRPFFIEGRNIFNFRLTPGDGDLSGENLFYSRRIGRAPQHRPRINSGAYIDMPNNTPILGAIKLSGKTEDGLSVGLMQSLTGEQNASIFSSGTEYEKVVEPLTSYTAGRLQKDFNEGNSILGGMFTSTIRNLSDSSLYFLHRSAYSGGIDYSQYWNDKTWYLSTKFLFSHVRGEEEAISYTQQSPVHYFQRPDASHLEVDPARTSLTGHGGTIEGGKTGGRLNFIGIVHWKSPGLELNDIGYIRNADEIFQILWIGYRIWEPFGIFRRVNLSFNQFYSTDFGGKTLGRGANINGHTQFKNYWSLGAGTNVQLERYSTHVLRGGPSLLLPGSINNWVNISSDNRKNARFSANFSRSGAFEGEDKNFNYSLTATFLPHNALRFSLSPAYRTNKRELQYVSRVTHNGNNSYIMGKLEQKTASVAVRINYSLTPELSLQFYGEPFISSGSYSDFKHITDPAAGDYYDRFSLYSSGQVHFDDENNRYYFDENSNGSYDYNIGNPNFNALYFNSNLVFRWEYLPGSHIYLVWSQNRNQFAANGHFSFKNHTRELFDLQPHNVFMLKASYRIGN